MYSPADQCKGHDSGYAALRELERLGGEDAEVERVHQRQQTHHDADAAVVGRWDDSNKDEHGAEGKSGFEYLVDGGPLDAADDEVPGRDFCAVHQSGLQAL